MRRIWLFFSLLIILFSACVPNRKLVYLQKDDLKKRDDIPKDTVLRTHELAIQPYRIQPLDILSINFESLSEESDQFDFFSKLNARSGSGSSNTNAVSSGILVDGSGEIEYAVLGKIKVAGLTLFEAQDAIRRVASQYMPDLVVRVRMMNFRFTVLGEVNGEGTVVSNNTRVTMMEAIGLAGGLSELADRSHVKVLRQRGHEVEVFYLNLLKEDYVESPYFFIQQNDVIIVPPLKQRPFRRYFTNNLGIITSAISFTVLIITLSR